MTLEDKLLDRLERLAGENIKLARLADENYRDVLGLIAQRDSARAELEQVRTWYSQACEAHDKLKARCKELESKLSRKGKKR